MENSIQADSIVIYSGLKPRMDEAEKFIGSADEVLLLGDCTGQNGTLQKTIRSAFFVAFLGGGGSGMVAAVRAAQLTGKKVIVLEKASATGGAAQFAATIRTFGSKWQAWIRTTLFITLPS